MSEIKVADRADAVTGWSKPVTVSDPEDRAGRPTLTLGRNGQAVLVRAASGSSEGGTTDGFARRPAGSLDWELDWEAEEPVEGFETGAWRKAVVGPEGDVTLLGVAPVEGDGYGALTITRSAATGNWSAVKALSTVYVPDDRFDLAVGPDGSVHAVWTQGDTFRRLMTSSRVNGAWSAAPVPLNTGAGDYAIGQIAVGPDNRPVAVWDESTGDFTTQVRAATTAPPLSSRCPNGVTSAVTARVTSSR